MSAVDSSLAFAFVHCPTATRLRLTTQEPPQRIIRAFNHEEDGTALVHLHNLSGGVLGGDRLRLGVTVEPGARGQVTTTSATRVYRHRPGREDASQETHLHVQAGGLLEYLPDMLIPFAGARYRQQTRIELEEDAGLFYWELVAPGRIAADECFAYERVQMDLSIHAQAEPILQEHFVLEPQCRPLSGPGQLGPFHYFAGLYVCRVGVGEGIWEELEAELMEMAQARTQAGVVVWGVSRLPAHGLVVRAVGCQSRSIGDHLPCFWSHARQRLYGSRAALPRKIY